MSSTHTFLRKYPRYNILLPGRSATIVAAYLMYSQNLDCETALDIIRKARPNISYVQLPSLPLYTFTNSFGHVCRPNDGFLLQLEVFHKAAFKISRRDKTTRMFYMERAVEEVMSEPKAALNTRCCI